MHPPKTLSYSIAPFRTRTTSSSEALEAGWAVTRNTDQRIKMTAQSFNNFGHRDGPPESGESQAELPNSDFEVVRRSFGFWAIIVGLGIMLLLAALEK